MPDEYISREKTLALLKSLGSRDYRREKGTIQDAIKMISSSAYTPAADVAEVVHGEWLRADDDWNSLTTIQCSLCSEEWCFETDDDVSLLNYKYCPNCGARMDGAAGEEECKDFEQWRWPDGDNTGD